MSFSALLNMMSSARIAPAYAYPLGAVHEKSEPAARMPRHTGMTDSAV